MKKPKSKTVISEATRQEVVADMADFLSNVPELNEAFTRADIELALDDRGWLVPGRQWTASDLDAQSRTTLVAKSRLYWMKDPLAKQAVRLHVDYSLSNGITYSSEDAGIQKKLDAFCKHRRNRVIMNSEGQRRSAKKMLVDGELFFAIFTDDDPHTVRRIDPLQITDIITDPEDDEHVLGYRRLTANNKVLVYPDWRCDDGDIALLGEQPEPLSKSKISSKPGMLQDNVVVYHAPFDTLLKRGNGLLFSIGDWSKEHRRFMEARVAIVQALAKFAWQTKVKGGQAVVNQMINKLQSTYSQTGAHSIERHPAHAPASNFVSNEGVEMTPVPRVTGGSEARQDGDALKLMVCAGTGIMLHYFGDPSTGNLATATAMELPMLKMFESEQQMWLDIYRDLFSIVLDEDPDEEPAVIDIDLPPILDDDLQKLGTFLTAATIMFPELKVDEVLQMLLNSLGVNNVEEVMKSIKAKRVELDQKAAELAKQQAALGGAPGAPGAPKPAAPGASKPVTEADQIVASNKELAESFNRLAKLLEA